MSQEAWCCPPSEEDRNACTRVALQTGIIQQGRDACKRCWLKWLGQEAELTGTDMGGSIRKDEAGNVIDWGITGHPGEAGITEALK